MKTYKKSEAFQAVLDLKAGNNHKVDLDELLRYFAPTTKKPKTAEEWAAKACAGKAEIRKYLQCLYVKNGEMFGCDGHRVHIVKTQFADGWYDSKTLQRLTEEAEHWVYPDVRKVISPASSRSITKWI